jgi:hypothetical protein
MVTTRHRTMTDKTFDHVVITMNINVKQHTYHVLRDNDITSANKIIGFTEVMLSNFVADEKDDQDTVIDHDKTIPYYLQELMLILGTFFREKKKALGGKLEESNILAATKQEWSQYRIDAPIPASNVRTNATPVTNTFSIPSEAKEFRKGNKRDASQYPVLKDERLYERWYCTVTNLAKTHQVIDVFNPSYKPITDEETLLFEVKQQFVFNVLDVFFTDRYGYHACSRTL